jgi:predicted SAM-dependent methyltransferase
MLTKTTENLDIGCSDKKRKGFLGMDNRILDGVDVVHDIENTPWPFDKEQFYTINASHVLEHLKPWKFFEVMDEAWRVVQVGGGMDIRVPIGMAYKVDPSHTIEFNIASFWYLDPSKDFYETYKPKPWKIVQSHADQAKQEIRVILQKEQK